MKKPNKIRNGLKKFKKKKVMKSIKLNYFSKKFLKHEEILLQYFPDERSHSTKI